MDDYGDYGDVYDIPDTSGYSDWSQPQEMPGSAGSSLQYGSDIESPPMDWSKIQAQQAQPEMPGSEGSSLQYGSDIETPELAAAFNQQPGLMDTLQKIPESMQAAFMKKLSANPISTLAQLLSAGAGAYSTLQGSKQRDALARQISDARAAREAKLAQYGAVKPLKMERTMHANQGDLLTAGQRPGGLNWFTPTKFTPMADGGQVQPNSTQDLQKQLSDLDYQGFYPWNWGDDARNQIVQQRAELRRRLANSYKPEGLWATTSPLIPPERRAEGGSVNPSWLDRIIHAYASRTPSPSVMGAGTAAGAGEAIRGTAQGISSEQNKPYQMYLLNQESEGAAPLPYELWLQAQRQGRAHGGLSSLIHGEGGGQDDKVPISASPGEYIIDADAVSALGDGDNAAGAAKLKMMVEKLRAHKRKAPTDDIPPKAKHPEAYLKGGK